MPQVLTRLKITEVSAVDRGAGDGTKIILMKRDDSGSDDWRREQSEISERMNKEHLMKHDRSFSAVLARMEMAKADAANGDVTDRNRNRNDVGNASVHPAVQIATLLVASGKFPGHAQALDHLLNTSRGQALLSRMSKAADQTGKDYPNMDKIETLRDIAKAGGIVAVAKAIIDENRSYGITEHEFVALATEHAKSAHPELSGAQAFAKLYQIPEIWRACAVLKSAAPYFDPQVQVVGGADARDVNDPSAALAALHRIGRERWPDASEAIRFTRAFEANPELARKAHVRPSATSIYEFPRG
jgi:hypothetical protein